MSRRPAAWRPPAVMPALAEGEAVRPWPLEVWGAPATWPPATAPGFQAAWRLGLLPPPPPAVPPSPVPGLSSWDRIRLGVLLAIGVFGLLILVAGALDAGALSALLPTTAFCAGAWLLWSVEGRDELEHAAGYTSGHGCTGLWRLDRDGRVLRPPDRSVPPPGWYPSPYYPGLLQRWDGPGWKPVPQGWWHRERAYFRAPVRPFL